MIDFDGVKIALLIGDDILVIQRDDKPGLRFAGMWDLPGGAREHNETPFECVNREVAEELGIHIQESSLLWQKTYPAMHDAHLKVYFMVADINEYDMASIIFGDEGQGWKVMPVKGFMSDKQVIAPLKDRLQTYLDTATT